MSKTNEKSFDHVSFNFRVFKEEMTFYINIESTPPVLAKLLEDEYKATLAWNWFLESFTREDTQARRIRELEEQIAVMRSTLKTMTGCTFEGESDT